MAKLSELTDNQQNLASFYIMEALTTTVREDEEETIQYFIDFVATDFPTDESAYIQLEGELSWT